MHQNKHQNKNDLHQPVLLDEVVSYLDPQVGDSYLDLTAGYGGHATAVLDRIGTYDTALLVDRDLNAITELERKFAGTAIELRQSDFLTVSQELASSGRKFNCILADLGVSSPHLNDITRGFAIQGDAPLDMRMDQNQSLSADSIVNRYGEADLAELLSEYGQEPKAKRMAHMIVTARPIRTTGELARIVSKAWPGHSRVHPATRTFQAIRIAVNDELAQIEKSLPLWLKLLEPGGRLVVISFHSLEDKLVKQAFSDSSGERYDAEMRLLTKRPVTASHEELVHNPRARSAKLRAAVKINT